VHGYGDSIERTGGRKCKPENGNPPAPLQFTGKLLRHFRFPVSGFRFRVFPYANSNRSFSSHSSATLAIVCSRSSNSS